ncbi:phosphotransferase family protein [Microbacterium gorillae]|uniref:phosphotransferase family protein n=1 Tax=Microbacterium gorillae TaxID=1231063 RepID=UPI000590C370|nr:phosphotransferase family protein [Microbacterium gorillae]
MDELSVVDTHVAAVLGRAPSALSRRTLSGGMSQTTLLYAADGADAAVVRIPPRFGPLEPYDPPAEARLISWVRARGLAVPEVLFVEETGQVLDRSFFGTRVIDGVAIQDGAHGLSDERKQEMAEVYVATLARIHAMGAEPTARAELAWAPEKTPDAVLRRWEQSLDGAPIVLPAYHRYLHDWLRSHPLPASTTLSVVHGDYRLANMMFGADGALAAVLDWEESGYGDPYFDLGWSLVGTVEDGDLVMGLLTREQFLADYAEATGAPIDRERLLWWEVAAAWSKMCMDSKAVSLIADGRYTDVRPMMSCYTNRAVASIALRKIERADALIAGRR